MNRLSVVRLRQKGRAPFLWEVKAFETELFYLKRERVPHFRREPILFLVKIALF
jgi:folate-dependent tRNA-U54 methylase TrmFO/GidA